MKQILLIGVLILSACAVRAQMPVVAPSTDMQLALNHVEQMNNMVQTYQTMVNVKDGIDKGIDAVEKVNTKLTTIREVQEIATRSAACINRIKKVYQMITEMKVDVRYTTDLIQMCSQTTRQCVDVTAYGAKVFSDRFLRMSDAERLAETRKVLDDLDKLVSKVNYINVQANAIKFNNDMINSYIR